MVSEAPPDPRRMSEADPDFQRVRSVWLRRLMASVRQLVRDIQQGGPHGQGISAAQSAFIHRHTTLLQGAYLAAYREGQRDYWQAVSLTPERWLRRRVVQPSVAQTQRRLMYYAAASVAKLAREAEVVYNHAGYSKRARRSPSSANPASVSSAYDVATLAEPPADLAFDQFAAWVSPRVGLQVDITWSGFQDGYLDAASADTAGLRLQLWWELEPAAQHCDDCPLVAAGSPYDAPGSGPLGGNELGQTPGDGQTACGAGCKCSLRWGWTDLSGAALLTQDNELLIPPDVTPIPPIAARPPTTEAPEVSRLPSYEEMTRPYGPPPRSERIEALEAAQKRALDNVRLAIERWNGVRGQLPPLELLGQSGSVPASPWDLVDIDQLTPEQKAALSAYYAALREWVDALPLDAEIPGIPGMDDLDGMEHMGL